MNVTENCPYDGCQGEVSVELEYEPADPNHGADANGNRGIYVAGSWSATVADTCSRGCALDADAVSDVSKDAIWQGERDREDEYYGPDSEYDE